LTEKRNWIAAMAAWSSRRIECRGSGIIDRPATCIEKLPSPSLDIRRAACDSAPVNMAGANNAILDRMLERLYASLVQGPCLNCRPHSSRQRVDLNTLQAFNHLSPNEIIPKLLTGSGRVEVMAKIPPFVSALDEALLSETDRVAKRAFENQARLLGKLRDIAADARDYEQETGENALYIGYPLISIPPGADALGESTARVFAPLTLIPVELTVKRGATQSIGLTAKGEGVDLVIANFPLLAWLEQQTGRDTSELYTDDDGSQPWREINEIAKLLADGLQIGVPPEFTAERLLDAVPRFEQLAKEPTFLNAAVLGLFPLSNQGLLRDMKAMAGGESLTGPIENFLSARIETATPPVAAQPPAPPKRSRNFTEERLVSDADPCQARAVRLAKEASTLVIHGPPGTGKSQTITNIIGDHLARGERVLLVCDKRTALDVVQNRLEHLGLGDLCAVVHDPQRDQRALYMKIRDQLENLVERKTNAAAEARLQQTDEELQRIHLELTGYFSALAEPPAPGQLAFHDLVGEWFNIENFAGIALAEDGLAQATLAEFAAAESALREVLERARKADYPHNPWGNAAGLELGALLSRPVAEFRSRLTLLADKAPAFDATWTDGQPSLLAGNLNEQAANRELLAKLLLSVAALELRDEPKLWFDKAANVLRQTLAGLEDLNPSVALVSSGSLDAELRSSLAAKLPALTELNQAIAALQQYSSVAGKWYGFLCFGKKSAAQKIATSYGLSISPDTSERLQTFLAGLKARLVAQDFLQRVFATNATSAGVGSDAELLSTLGKYRALLTALVDLHEKAPSILLPLIAEALAGATKVVVEKLSASAVRANALASFLADMAQSKLFATTWLAEVDSGWRNGKPATPVLSELIAKFDSVETILRLRLAREKVPASLRAALASLITQSVEPDPGLSALKQALRAKEISTRIRTNPFLQQIDQERMNRCFQRYRELEAGKRTLVRDAVLHQWVNRQKSRLLAATGTQLNSDGTGLKRRLLTRGERAMKLRQMILAGAQGAQPDPLFDMCPVWMASPGTVAQIFPRQPVFDAIVFDEASQCRLEEALPVLTRGRRVVIAGDPQQLPPTRFFESALVESETDDAETEQGLFEQQQGETEDLLAAALNIEVQQSYLDVHYRSRNEGLIGFSNQNFYQDRLQPIPGHPTQRARQSPIRLIRAEGIYENRGNLKEAELVCEIIAELLARPNPPSIGVACFNLTQRDVILDTLEERCERDPQFAQRLESARNRRGHGSFEGLFVKNLENVQGDERDHMIISTTFGPDANGKFRRNFGPVGRQGGGRRLNVLVTRAREMIHLITSIPRGEYAALPQLESGQTAGGRWLLSAYLHYAETLCRCFDEEEQRRAQVKVNATPTVRLNTDENSSRLAVGLAHHLAKEQALSSDVPWGNAAFCVDIALHHPVRAEEVSLGVLCDMTRFAPATDPVEWDLFRTGVLEKQGWKFHRIWSPALYSDPERHKRAIAQAAQTVAESNRKPK
jgi:hypothetical protein